MKDIWAWLHDDVAWGLVTGMTGGIIGLLKWMFTSADIKTRLQRQEERLTVVETELKDIAQTQTAIREDLAYLIGCARGEAPA